jgi:predicted DNA-binding ribbon-helix-helix protein
MDCRVASLLAMTVKFSGPIKRSMMIAGHATSISLEPIFWQALRDAAAEEGLPLNALVARIDAERVQAPNPPNLGSAIRVWLFERKGPLHGGERVG